jgi:hypothetical protein
MNLDPIINQIKVLSPVFNGQVAGAAQFAAAKDQTWLTLPAAFVIIGDFEASANESATGLRQTLTEEVAVVVIYGNATDRRGQAPAEQYMTVRAQLNTALLNWRPDWDPNNPQNNIEARGFSIVRGSLGEMDGARLLYEYVYALETYLTDDDGWQLPSVPLTQIGGTISAPGTDISVVFATDTAS